MGHTRFIVGLVGFGTLAFLGVAVGLLLCITIVLFIPGLLLMGICCWPLSRWIYKYNLAQANLTEANPDNRPWYEMDDSEELPPWQN